MTSNLWLVFALLSALFAAMTSIFAKVGIEGVNINNGPSRRLISIAEPVTARYLRMDVQQLVGDGDGFQSVDSDIEAF